MKPEVHVLPKYSNSKPEFVIHHRELLSPQAAMAAVLMEKWGMVACNTESGEDSAGRQKFALQSPQEVVDRACEMASLAFAAFRKLDWVITLPSWEEASDAALKADDEAAAVRKAKKVI